MLTVYRSFPIQIEAIVDIDFSLSFGTLGSDQNHTTSCPCTIDRRRGGILQDRYALDVVRVQGTEIALYIVD